MTYRPSIAERIAWTSGQLRSADAKVLVALWSCGDYETGRYCRPYVKTIVARSGLARATVTRTLKRLRDDGWIIPTLARHRQATAYDIQIDRLATSPPKEQQMSIDAALAVSESEAQNEPQANLEAQIEPLLPELEAQNEPPTSDPDLYLEERTHTPRARENSATDPELPLIGQTPRARCLHPHKHAWCDGRVHVPKDLHFEFFGKLDTQPGESSSAKAGRLVAFYAATDASIPATQAIGVDGYTFWKRAFAAAFPFEQPSSGQGRVRYRNRPALQYDDPLAVARRKRQDDDETWIAAHTATASAAVDAMNPTTYAALRIEAESDRLKQFKPRMAPDEYVRMIREAMISLLLDRARAEERAARSRKAEAS